MSVLGRFNPNEETHERRAAQAELKIAPDQCGPETQGEKTCGTRLNTVILAPRSTSKESSNPSACRPRSASRGSNKNSVTPYNRDAIFGNIGVVQDLLKKLCRQFQTAAWPLRIMTTSLSHVGATKLVSHEWLKTRTHHNTNQQFCGDNHD